MYLSMIFVKSFNLKLLKYLPFMFINKKRFYFIYDLIHSISDILLWYLTLLETIVFKSHVNLAKIEADKRLYGIFEWIKMSKNGINEIKLLEELNDKIDKILTTQYDILSVIKQNKYNCKPLDVFELLDLPDHVRKTAMAMNKFKKATAEDIALETGRERSIESAYLNQLVRSGYLKKKRDGRRVIFYYPE